MFENRVMRKTFEPKSGGVKGKKKGKAIPITGRDGS
jgi:hypothetical protein